MDGEIKFENLSKKNTVINRLWPNIGQFQDAPQARLANFALGSLYGTGVKPSELTQRAKSILRKNRGQNREIAKASVAAMRLAIFLFDNCLHKPYGT